MCLLLLCLQQKLPESVFFLAWHEDTEETDDQVDLRTEMEGEVLVAHGLVHFDVFDYNVFRNSLRVKS